MTKVEIVNRLWPVRSDILIMSVALPVILFQLADISWLKAVSIAADERRGLILHSISISLIVSLFLASTLSARYGIEGCILAIFGFLVSVMLATHFRSDFIRPGTFDFFEDRIWNWLLLPCVAVLLGAILGLIVRHRNALQRRVSILVFIWPLLLFVFGLQCQIHHIGSQESQWSQFPFTRHIALYVLAALLVVIGVVGLRVSSNEEI